MHAFLTGPFFYFSLGVCLMGAVVRLVLYFKGLSWQLDRVAYTRYPMAGLKGAFRSIYRWLLPFGTRAWRKQPVMTAAVFGFHIGVVCLPLFLAGHTEFLKAKLGIALPAMGSCAADIISWIALGCLALLFLRRLVLPEVRILTDRKDIGVLILTLLPLATGLLSRYQVGSYDFWLNAHIFTGELVLLAIPFTKLSHVFLFFASRAQLGMDFGIKRGGMKGTQMNW